LDIENWKKILPNTNMTSWIFSNMAIGFCNLCTFSNKNKN
jgi:hypothetical protein